MRTIGQTYRCTGAGDFLNHNGMCQIGHFCPTIGFVHCHAQQAQIPHFTPKFIRKFIGAINLGGHGFDPFLRPTMHSFLQGMDIFTQIERHRM